MITQAEENYLRTIPQEKTVSVKPYNPKIKVIVDSIILSIKNVFLNLEVIHMGAAALEISGQNDIDIYILIPVSDFDSYLPRLIEIFGKPKTIRLPSIAWEFKQESFEITVYLTDPDTESLQRQLKVFEILRSNEGLLEEYKNLKENMNGKPLRDYQRKKYEFYNKILEMDNNKVRKGIVLIVKNKEGKLLLFVHGRDGLWSLISGGCEPGEEILDTVVREAKEEANLDVDKNKIIQTDDVIRFVSSKGPGEQKVFLYIAENTDGIKPDGVETIEFGWFEKEEAIEKLSQKPPLAEIVKKLG